MGYLVIDYETASAAFPVEPIAEELEGVSARSVQHFDPLA